MGRTGFTNLPRSSAGAGGLGRKDEPAIEKPAPPCQPKSKRVIDLVGAAVLLGLLAPLLVLIAVAVRLSSKGPAFHVSKRVGRENEIFEMLKFRTMRSDTPQLATHLMTRPERYLTPLGRLLRRTSLDEFPQLINVLRGDMSLVGPRPALFNQDDLIELRTRKGVHGLRPGITGWAQVHGRDEISIAEKVELDAYYLRNQNVRLDLQILCRTLARLTLPRDIKH